ncbi:ATP-binding protein [Parvularcula oceani]|uniref:ATP-binding protein n=1 Tax=Parvularcula oceani TaxID=1247963 RepID=UPI0004E16EAC|nr:DUF87 domain-containing protein [Parvularcula oceani]
MMSEEILTLTSESQEPGRGRRRVGRVIANTGAVVLVMIERQGGAAEILHTGDLLIVGRNSSLCVGAVSSMSVPAPAAQGETDELWIAEVELYGALSEDGAVRHGLPRPPALGDPACLAGEADIRALYGPEANGGMRIGTVAGTPYEATVAPAALTGGFALLGSADFGKSCSMAVLVRALLRAREPVHPVLLDIHDEYGRSFGRAARIIRPGAGFLPHWLLTSDELAWVLSLSGGPLLPEERSLLDEGVPYARRRTLQRADPAALDGSPVDGPLPYRIGDLLSWLDKTAQQDALRGAVVYERLRTRLRSATADGRLRVIFGGQPGQDTLGEFVHDVFSLRRPGPLLSVLQLGKLPLGLEGLFTAVIARIGTALAEGTRGAVSVLLLLEEADRFAPADTPTGVTALSSAALEKLVARGARSGIGLGFTSDRASEVSGRLLREAPTVFVHRMSGEADRTRVTAALPEAANAFLSAAATLGRSEVVACGKAVPVPGRLLMDSLPDAAVPGQVRAKGPRAAEDMVEDFIRRWRFGSEAAAADLPPRVSRREGGDAVPAA